MNSPKRVMGLAQRKRVILAVSVTVVVGAVLRLWGIDSLFNAVHDYDPGVHALAARFITEGYLPYRDFAQVHPPLYDFVLAAVFKVFGYEFLYGRYLSVCLSLASLVLVYFLGRHLYGRRVGIIAALLFAVEPMMVYLGRRCVQEALGLLLVLIGATLAVRYLEQRRTGLLFWCGLVLGLAISTKYVFVPVTVAIGCAVLLLALPRDMWKSTHKLGSLRFWAQYTFLSAAIYSILFVLRYTLRIPVALPFADPLQTAPGDLAVSLLVFGVPLLLLWRWWTRGLHVVPWFRSVWTEVIRQRLWLLVVGSLAGFLAVTGYFWITMPGAYLQQTVFWQMGRATTEVPSLVGMARIAFLSSAFFRMSLLSIVAMVPLALVLLNRKPFTRGDCFLAVVIVVTIALSQAFYQLPRYYASALLFGLVAIASFAFRSSDKNPQWSRVGSFAALAVLLLCGSLSVVLLTNYTGYDVGQPGAPTSRAIYDETNAVLEKLGASRVFSTNPIYPALSDSYESSLSFDVFAVVFLEEKSAAEILATLREEGVDYVIVEEWTRFWQTPPYQDLMQDMVREIRVEGSLVALVEPDTAHWVEVYRLGPAPETLVNGDFAYWSDYTGLSIPTGWNPVLIGGAGDAADISPSGLGTGGVRLIVYEDGVTEPGATSTHAGLSRRLAFPRGTVSVRVLPEVNTESLGATPLGPAIHFIDDQGHSVILGFSDTVQEEEVSVCEECGHVAVIQPAPLYNWSDHSIDVAKYWKEAGWPIPDEVTVLVVLSADSQYPGYYTCHVGEVTVSSPVP